MKKQNEIILTEEQEEVVNKIKAYLDSPTDFEPFTLKGVAGAGKTTVIRLAVEDRGVSIVGATISHSAKFVLEQSLNDVAHCYTLAQLLGLRQHINEEGEIHFLPGYSAYGLPIDTADILIIDECSMIGKTLLKQILDHKQRKTKLIFLGDPYQLPPIEDEEDSETFAYTRAELLIPIRYEGPISDLGTHIRHTIDSLNKGEVVSEHVINHWQTSELGNMERTSQVNEDGSGYIFLNNIDDVIRIALSEFAVGYDPESMRLMAYRNASISKINDVVRAQLHAGGDENLAHDIPEFVPGELIICNGGYSVFHFDEENSVQKTVPVIYNNQTFRVQGTTPVTGPSGIASLSMNLNPAVRLPPGTDIIALDWENGRYNFFEINNDLKRQAKADGKKWKNYFNFREQWAWFDYAYAINSHKGLAATWPL